MKRRDGFTLIELLTVLGIIGLLATMLLPSFVKVLEFARQGGCQSNLKQLSAAVWEYTDAYKGKFPPRSMDGGAAPTRWWGYDDLTRARGEVEHADIFDFIKKTEVFRCPEMVSGGWEFNSKYVGYGYNAWFLGNYGGPGSSAPTAMAGITPFLWATVGQVKNSSQLIIFGDSAYRGGGTYGASYAMWYPIADSHVDLRHGEKGNVVYLDGSAKACRDWEVNPPQAPTADDRPFVAYWDPQQGLKN